MFVFCCHWQHKVLNFVCSFCPMTTMGLLIFLPQCTLKIRLLTLLQTYRQLNSTPWFLVAKKVRGVNFSGCPVVLEDLRTFYMVANTCVLNHQIFCDRSTLLVPYSWHIAIPRLGSISSTGIAIILMSGCRYLLGQFWNLLFHSFKNILWSVFKCRYGCNMMVWRLQVPCLIGHCCQFRKIITADGKYATYV